MALSSTVCNITQAKKQTKITKQKHRYSSSGLKKTFVSSDACPLQEKLDAINTALVLYQVLISSVKQNRDIVTSEILKKKTKRQ